MNRHPSYKNYVPEILVHGFFVFFIKSTLHFHMIVLQGNKLTGDEQYEAVVILFLGSDFLRIKIPFTFDERDKVMENDIRETFFVQGMSCSGCETVIEKTLIEIDGIKDIKASFAKNQVTVRYDPGKIGFRKIRATLKNAGYTIEKAQSRIADESAGEKDKSVSGVQFISIVIIFLALYLIISNTVGFNFIPEVTSSMNYGVLFVAGLLTSLHCIAMCGGINISQCVNDAATGERSKLKPSLLYNLGRVASYTILGGIIGALGLVIHFSGWARGLVAILSGIFMIIIGISMTGLFPWINKITPRLPRIFRVKAGMAARGRGPFIVGLLNGLMPCGPLQAMQVYALGTGSFITGALSMFFFSLGTLPLMFGLGAITTMLGSKFTKKMMKLSAVLVAVLGIIMLGRGLALSGAALPSLNTENAASTVALTSASTNASSVAGDGVQNIVSTLTGRGYPDITVKKGVPVVWNLQADENNINGCNRTLVISEYNIQADLKAGDNIIEFTPTESGKLIYSCWMGMQTGTITVTD